MSRCYHLIQCYYSMTSLGDWIGCEWKYDSLDPNKEGPYNKVLPYLFIVALFGMKMRRRRTCSMGMKEISKRDDKNDMITRNVDHSKYLVQRSVFPYKSSRKSHVYSGPYAGGCRGCRSTPPETAPGIWKISNRCTFSSVLYMSTERCPIYINLLMFCKT